MLFEQDQATAAVGKVVIEEADSRHKSYEYQSDGMSIGDVTLQE